MADIENIHARVCSILLSMAGKEVFGVRNSELADALGVPRPTISRDLAKLVEIGIAEQMPNDATRYRLGPKLIQIARAHAEGMALVQHQLDEVIQRYSRNPT